MKKSKDDKIEKYNRRGYYFGANFDPDKLYEINEESDKYYYDVRPGKNGQPEFVRRRRRRSGRLLTLSGLWDAFLFLIKWAFRLFLVWAFIYLICWKRIDIYFYNQFVQYMNSHY